MPPARAPPRALPHKYPDTVLHHHHNLYVDFRREHDHEPEQHDGAGKHTDDWTDSYFGPACFDDHDDGPGDNTTTGSTDHTGSTNPSPPFHHGGDIANPRDFGPERIIGPDDHGDPG